MCDYNIGLYTYLEEVKQYRLLRLGGPPVGLLHILRHAFVRAHEPVDVPEREQDRGKDPFHLGVLVHKS